MAALLVALSGLSLSGCGVGNGGTDGGSSGSETVETPEVHTLPPLTSSEIEAMEEITTPGLFCGNADLTNFDLPIFTDFLGLETKVITAPVSKAEDLGLVLSKLTAPEQVFLYLDPLAVSSEEGSEELAAFVQVIRDFADTHSDTETLCMMASHPLSTWVGLSEEEETEIMGAYETWMKELSGLSKTYVFFHGYERWLILNGTNFIGEMPNSDIAKRLMLLSFADRKYRVDSKNCGECLEILTGHINKERDTPSIYPDLSGCDVVLLGDSIIGNYSNSASIPGAISGLSGARTYNLGKGGAVGSTKDPVEDINSFLSMLRAFRDGEVSRSPEDCPYKESLERYLADDHSGKKLYFVVNFGMNDYFAGNPVMGAGPEDETAYEGAIREGIRELKEAYPEAVIIVMTPNPTTFFENGTIPMYGTGGTLEEYAIAAKEAAAAEGVLCLDNYTELGITPDNANLFLEDGVHYNEAARMIVAERVIYTVATSVP